MNDFSHDPVMADEIIAHLITNKNGNYIDLTAGLGGHLKAFSKQLNQQAKLYGVDKDSKAVRIAKENLQACHQKIYLYEAPYAALDSLVEQFDDTQFDGVLLDLGISSMQIDDAERGFSFSKDGPLDMRFDEHSTETASDIVNRKSEAELADIFFKYGEERQGKKIAKAIVTGRQKEMIQTTSQLTAIIYQVVNPPFQTKSTARIFQALRIAVNRELEQLESVLPQIVHILKTGGRIAVLSYHSLEDRIIKRFFQKLQKGCTCPDEIVVCICGNKPQLKIITKKPELPSESEIERNSRARSAKLRVAEKI